MEKKMTILYEVGEGLYVNLTNKCPCACTFCIRNEGDGAYGSESLWLKHEPSFEEIVEEFKKFNLGKYKEIVFCGYGEPTERIELLVQVADYVRSVSDIKIRINTNGLGNLIHSKSIEHLLEGRIDIVSISLNAPNAEDYAKVTRPKYGIASFDAMLKFASECKKYVPTVVFTVVDCIPQEQIEASRKIAEQVGVNFRIRELI
ncbi:MAG: TIGR04100 family radical SAM protein [Cellulosilyticum sp.]|nr:TIGR04100 family radical SAM protein [Cellulosilyticum sp.]